MIDSQNGFMDARVGGFDDGGATGDAETGKNTAAGDSDRPAPGRSVDRGRTVAPANPTSPAAQHPMTTHARIASAQINAC
jgi:hypothetical protein